MILIAINDVSCNHITIQSFHHHEDTLLALLALFSNPTEVSESLVISIYKVSNSVSSRLCIRKFAYLRFDIISFEEQIPLHMVIL